MQDPTTRYFVVYGEAEGHPHILVETCDLDEAKGLRTDHVFYTESELVADAELRPLLEAWKAGDDSEYAEYFRVAELLAPGRIQDFLHGMGWDTGLSDD